MSFILDAIKKSEDERKRAKQPDVHSLQDGAVRHVASPPSTLARLGLLAIAITILIAGLWWFWPQLSEQLAVRLDQSSSVGAETAAGESTVKQSTQAEEHIVATGDSGNTATQIRENYLQDDKLPPRHLIKELWELPADFQSTVPKLEFSFHVFSSEPSKRTIIINGRRMREGQLVASGLKLRLITESGIILFYRGRFFHVDVIEKW